MVVTSPGFLNDSFRFVMFKDQMHAESLAFLMNLKKKNPSSSWHFPYLTFFYNFEAKLLHVQDFQPIVVGTVQFIYTQT